MTTYLVRAVLPDRPGSLGALATALGRAGADIISLDVLERGPDGAVDDLVVDLPSGMADALLTAAASVPGVQVESVRPYPSGADIHRDLELVDELAAAPTAGLDLLVASAPGVFRAGWAVLVERRDDGTSRVLLRSSGAPETADMSAKWLPLAKPRRVKPDEAWVPERWRLLGMEMAAAPVGVPDRAVLVGRPGGPRFRAGEVPSPRLPGGDQRPRRRRAAGRRLTPPPRLCVVTRDACSRRFQRYTLHVESVWSRVTRAHADSSAAPFTSNLRGHA